MDRKQKKMEKKKARKIDKIIIYLNRNINSELKVVRFYEENLHIFTTQKERDSVKKLVLESLQHATTLINLKHSLESLTKKKLSKLRLSHKLRVLGEAMKEEKALEDIYRFEAAKLREKRIAGILTSIARMEIKHQKIVKDMASGIAEELSTKKAKSVLKKLKLT